ncbi:hypothetical protein QBC41DRAFT_47437 [Cercophora samala]|uniref:Uncharacterized protein n=1 Tax=Cercophora samala TaxID=330535 RepID=A0AA40D1M9_9PEZI|nr:hypothetical protein QBC41DRAFT_47437 [Cercophora samala]
MGNNKNKNRQGHNGGGSNNQGGNNSHPGNNSHHGNKPHQGYNSRDGSNSGYGNSSNQNNNHNNNNDSHNNNYNNNNNNNNHHGGRNGGRNKNRNNNNHHHNNSQNGNGSNNNDYHNNGNNNGNNNGSQNGNWNNNNNDQNGNWKKRRQQYWQLIAEVDHIGPSHVLAMFQSHSVRIGLLAQSYATVCYATGGYKSTEQFIAKHRAEIHDSTLFYVQGKFQDQSITPHVIAEKIEQFLEHHAAFIYEQWLRHAPQTHYQGFRIEDFLVHIRSYSAYAWEPIIKIEGVAGPDFDLDVDMDDVGSEQSTYLSQLCKFAPLPYVTVRFGLVNPDTPGHSYM